MRNLPNTNPCQAYLHMYVAPLVAHVHPRKKGVFSLSPFIPDPVTLWSHCFEMLSVSNAWKVTMQKECSIGKKSSSRYRFLVISAC